jgi:chromosomal replication initiator protein
MTLDPEQVWKTAINQLQMTMPRASFETWVRDTRLVSYRDGYFMIGTQNKYGCEWLTNHLTPTITHLLTEITKRDITVSFIIETQVFEEDQDEVDSQVESETTEVEVVHRLSYDEVVFPERVIALPGYFSRLIPEIGARNAWLYIGWRQAVWDGQRQDHGSKTKRIPVKDIIRFSGLSQRTFFRAVEDSSTWKSLSGLVERCDTEPYWSRGKDQRAHRLPNHYTVYITLPLSLADAASVQDWLEARMKEGMSLLDAVTNASQLPNLIGELLPTVIITNKRMMPDTPRTVMEITSLLAGGKDHMSPELQKASETLHQKIISSFGTILLTHYFLKTVIPQAKLTPAQAWLIALLRDHCYSNPDTGEVRDEVLVHGGYPELANWLGLNRPKTVWEWIHDSQGPVSAFLSTPVGSDQDNIDSLRLQVRLDEPIFDGASGTISDTQMASIDGAIGTIGPGANDTHSMADMAPLDGAIGTPFWREWHSLKHLNPSSTSQERTTPTTQNEAAVVPPPRWDLKKLLIQNHVHPKVTKELLNKNISPQTFISWLLYACSPAGEGINNPLAYALASLREESTQGPGKAYDQLAALPPKELIKLVHWSMERASDKYSLQKASSGNPTWDSVMKASTRHSLLFTYLVGVTEEENPK